MDELAEATVGYGTTDDAEEEVAAAVERITVAETIVSVELAYVWYIVKVEVEVRVVVSVTTAAVEREASAATAKRVIEERMVKCLCLRRARSIGLELCERTKLYVCSRKTCSVWMNVFEY